jgi:hypothetical protein
MCAATALFSSSILCLLFFDCGVFMQNYQRSLSKLTPDMNKEVNIATLLRIRGQLNVFEVQKGDYKWGGSFGGENI